MSNRPKAPQTAENKGQQTTAIERKQVRGGAPYSPTGLAIHHARYLLARNFVKGKKVLDIACGEGLGAFQMARHWGAAHVTGVDNSTQAIAAANREFSQTDGLCFVQSDAYRFLGETDARFDVIVCIETVEHVDNPEKFLASLEQKRAPGGIVILTCPNDPFYYGPGPSLNPHHKSTFSFSAFRDLSEKLLGPAQWLTGTKLAGFASIPMAHNGKKAIFDAENITVDGAGQMTPVVPVGAAEASLLKPDEGVYFAGVFGASSTQIAPTVSMICAASTFNQSTPGFYRQIKGRKNQEKIGVCFVCAHEAAAQVTSFSLEKAGETRLDLSVTSLEANDSPGQQTTEPMVQNAGVLQLHFQGITAFRQFVSYFANNQQHIVAKRNILRMANSKAGQIWTLGLDFPPTPPLSALELALLDLVLVKQDNGSRIAPQGKIIAVKNTAYFPHVLPEKDPDEREFLEILLAGQKRGGQQVHSLRMASLKQRLIDAKSAAS